MNENTRNLMIALRNALLEAHDTYIYSDDNIPHPHDCQFCNLVAQVDALLLAEAGT